MSDDLDDGSARGGENLDRIRAEFENNYQNGFAKLILGQWQLQNDSLGARCR